MATFNEKVQGIPMLASMNLQEIEDSPSRVSARLPLKDSANHVGAVYAGSLFALAEFPFGFLYSNRVSFSEMFPVVGEMTIRYLAPAMTDVTVDVSVSDEEWQAIEDETRAKGKMKIERETEIKDANGTVVAVAKTTYFSILVK